MCDHEWQIFLSDDHTLKFRCCRKCSTGDWLNWMDPTEPRWERMSLQNPARVENATDLSRRSGHRGEAKDRAYDE